MFHHDARHTGVSSDNTIGVGNAGNVGLDWAVNTGSASYTSPVVARSATLGKTLVYAANQMGALSAYNADSGVRRWVLQLGASIQSSPAIVNNVIYFGANDHHLYAVNALTASIEVFDTTTLANTPCSPMVDPSGSGLVVYFGENILGRRQRRVRREPSTRMPPPTLGEVDEVIHGDYGGANRRVVVGRRSATDVNGARCRSAAPARTAPYAVDALTAAGRVADPDLRPTMMSERPDIGSRRQRQLADGVVMGQDALVYASAWHGHQIWRFRSARTPSAWAVPLAYLNGVLYIATAPYVYAIDAVTGKNHRKTQDFPVSRRSDHRRSPARCRWKPGDVRRA
jgi:hypothetical protein